MDILSQYRPTTGLIEQCIKVEDDENVSFRIVDTGGQKNERRKWIHHFENVSAIVYVVSLAAFDEPLYEDETINSLHDSIKLFGDTMNNNSHWFAECKIFLVFNKKDIFQRKLEKQSLKTCFGDKYDEKEYYNDCVGIEEKVDKNIEFIKCKYLDVLVSDKNEVISFVVSAIDEKCVKFVYKTICSKLLNWKAFKS